MNLEEMTDSQQVDEFDPCVCRALILLPDEESRVEYPFSTRRHGRDRKVVIVVNEQGLAEYMMKDSDGHLGAVEDF